MALRFPAPLQAGDVVGVTSPSSGVPGALRPRLDVAVDLLRDRGFEVVLGECTSGEGVVSAPAADRAAELQAMLLDPRIRAVVPPWGGELAVEVLPHLDLDALAAAEPTWLVGYSDTSTLMLPLTVASGTATLHGPNLMDTPYRVPAPLLHWLDVAAAPAGSTLEQGAAPAYRSTGHDRWEDDPAVTELTVDATGGWTVLGGGRVDATGRLLGGCIETVSVLAGTSYGDVPAFAAAHSPDGLLLYLEAAESGALDIARHLWRMRLAGWFDVASAVLVGRTSAPDADGFSQRDAVVSALGDLDLPIVLDVDCGHVPPQLSLVNGALAHVVVDGAVQRLAQTLA